MLWKDLDSDTRGKIIQEAVKGGITSLKDIKNIYNEYAEGGNIVQEAIAQRQQEEQMQQKELEEMQYREAKRAMVSMLTPDTLEFLGIATPPQAPYTSATPTGPVTEQQLNLQGNMQYPTMDQVGVNSYGDGGDISNHYSELLSMGEEGIDKFLNSSYGTLSPEEKATQRAYLMDELAKARNANTAVNTAQDTYSSNGITGFTGEGGKGLYWNTDSKGNKVGNSMTTDQMISNLQNRGYSKDQSIETLSNANKNIGSYSILYNAQPNQVRANKFGGGGSKESPYSAGNLVDAIYNNSTEKFLGEPSHHYDFTQSEEWADAHGYFPDARGHRDDRVKKPAHPTHPSRGNWHGNYEFELSEKGISNPNYTLFGLSDGEQDPQAIMTYKGGIVLPEVTVTPNNSYINNPYDNIDIYKKSLGGHLFQEGGGISLLRTDQDLQGM